MIAAALLILLGGYLTCGLVFAIPFALVGVKKIDPHAAHGTWGFRLLIIPGTMAFWPLLLRRWFGGTQEPPEECTPHRPCGRVGQSGPDREDADSSGSRITHHASDL